MDVYELNHAQVKKTFKSIDVAFDIIFLSFSVLYYYRMYRRCSNFKTPYYPVNASFPMSTSNQVLAFDCTASSSDSFVLIFKAALFFIKSALKLILRNRLYIAAANNSEGAIRLIGEELNDPDPPSLFSSYPRQLYQIMLLMNAPLFCGLLFSSWLPVFTDFKPASRGCPGFIDTGWDSLSLTVKDYPHCNSEVYKWQRFAWASEFLWMVIINLSVYQALKISYNSYQLCGRGNPSCNEAITGSSVGWEKIESFLSLPSLCLLMSESIGIAYILSLSCYRFPGGANVLLKNYFTVAYTKVDDSGAVSKKFTDFTVSLTQFDQKLFYGILPYQLISIPLTVGLYVAVKKIKSDQSIRSLLQTNGACLRRLLEVIATLAPILTAFNFFLSSALVDRYESCYLLNFKKTFFNILYQNSEIITPGDKYNCNLYSVAAVLGSSILQTAIMTEIAFFVPIALMSLVVVFDLLLCTLLAGCRYLDGINPLRRSSFFYSQLNDGDTSSSICLDPQTCCTKPS